MRKKLTIAIKNVVYRVNFCVFLSQPAWFPPLKGSFFLDRGAHRWRNAALPFCSSVENGVSFRPDGFSDR